MKFITYEVLVYAFLILIGAVMIAASVEDVKNREIAHWKWGAVLVLSIALWVISAIFRPISAAAYINGKYALTNTLTTLDIQSAIIFALAVLIMFIVQIIFFKGIGGGDIKLMAGLNILMGFMPAIIGKNNFRCSYGFALPYHFYSMIDTKLYNWKAILWSFFACLLLLLIPLAISGVLSIPELIARTVKYKKLEAENKEREENGEKIKKIKMKKSVAFVPYLTAGYTIFYLAIFFFNTFYI